MISFFTRIFHLKKHYDQRLLAFWLRSKFSKFLWDCLNVHAYCFVLYARVQQLEGGGGGGEVGGSVSTVVHGCVVLFTSKMVEKWFLFLFTCRKLYDKEKTNPVEPNNDKGVGWFWGDGFFTRIFHLQQQQQKSIMVKNK